MHKIAVTENWQLTIRKKAVMIFVILVLLSVIQISMLYFNIDRISKSVINMVIFWPLYLVALYQSVLVVGYSIRHFRSISIIYLVSTIPVFAFLIYFVRELIITY
jgi:hypothetical protein